MCTCNPKAGISGPTFEPVYEEHDVSKLARRCGLLRGDLEEAEADLRSAVITQYRRALNGVQVENDVAMTLAQLAFPDFDFDADAFGYLMS